MWVKKQQLALETKQLSGFKLGKAYDKAYLTYMQSTSCKMPGWMETQAEIKIVRRNINNLIYADDSTLRQKAKNYKRIS